VKHEWEHDLHENDKSMEALASLVEKVPLVQGYGNLLHRLAYFQHLSAEDCWFVQWHLCVVFALLLLTNAINSNLEIVKHIVYIHIIRFTAHINL
jgi:hypothetical protein